MDIINTVLPKYGINIKLDTYENMLDEFKKLITSENSILDNFKTFEYLENSAGGATAQAPGDIEDKNFKIENNSFQFIKALKKGSFNKTSIYLNEITRKNVIVRHARSRDSIKDEKINIDEFTKDIFNNVYSNLKHIILYLLIRINKIRVKFIPEPYFFVLNKDISLGYYDFFMIMEIGIGGTLEDEIKSIVDINIDMAEGACKQFIFSIYYDLYLLEFIKFKHGDLKTDNVIVTEDGNPLIIDFDYSEFTVESLKFKSIASGEYSYYEEPYFNQVHDIMQLIVSLNYINDEEMKIDPYKIFTFIKNNNSNILDGNLLKQILTQIVDEENKNFREEQINSIREWIKDDPSMAAQLGDYENEEYHKSSIYDKLFFKDFYYKTFIELDKFADKDTFIKITPQQFAVNIGLDPDKEYLAEYYKRKYLKYKKKYIQLKNRAF